MSYVSDLRSLVGNMPLQLPGSNVIVYKQARSLDETQVLLQFRSDHRKLGLPGGGIESKETYPDCAIRELFEETGLICNPEQLKLLGVYAGGEQFMTIHPNGDVVHHTIVLYGVPFEKVSHASNTFDGETIRLQWTLVSEIHEYLKDSERKLFHCHIPIFEDLAAGKFF